MPVDEQQVAVFKKQPFDLLRESFRLQSRPSDSGEPYKSYKVTGLHGNLERLEFDVQYSGMGAAERIKDEEMWNMLLRSEKICP